MMSRPTKSKKAANDVQSMQRSLDIFFEVLRFVSGHPVSAKPRETPLLPSVQADVGTAATGGGTEPRDEGVAPVDTFGNFSFDARNPGSVSATHAPPSAAAGQASGHVKPSPSTASQLTVTSAPTFMPYPAQPLGAAATSGGLPPVPSTQGAATTTSTRSLPAVATGATTTTSVSSYTSATSLSDAQNRTGASISSVNRVVIPSAFEQELETFRMVSTSLPLDNAVVKESKAALRQAMLSYYGASSERKRIRDIFRRKSRRHRRPDGTKRNAKTGARRAKEKKQGARKDSAADMTQRERKLDDKIHISASPSVSSSSPPSPHPHPLKTNPPEPGMPPEAIVSSDAADASIRTSAARRKPVVSRPQPSPARPLSNFSSVGRAPASVNARRTTLPASPSSSSSPTGGPPRAQQRLTLASPTGTSSSKPAAAAPGKRFSLPTYERPISEDITGSGSYALHASTSSPMGRGYHRRSIPQDPRNKMKTPARGDTQKHLGSSARRRKASHDGVKGESRADSDAFSGTGSGSEALNTSGSRLGSLLCSLRADPTMGRRGGSGLGSSLNGSLNASLSRGTARYMSGTFSSMQHSLAGSGGVAQSSFSPVSTASPDTDTNGAGERKRRSSNTSVHSSASKGRSSHVASAHPSNHQRQREEQPSGESTADSVTVSPSSYSKSVATTERPVTLSDTTASTVTMSSGLFVDSAKHTSSEKASGDFQAHIARYDQPQPPQGHHSPHHHHRVPPHGQVEEWRHAPPTAGANTRSPRVLHPHAGAAPPSIESGEGRKGTTGDALSCSSSSSSSSASSSSSGSGSSSSSFTSSEDDDNNLGDSDVDGVSSTGGSTRNATTSAAKANKGGRVHAGPGKGAAATAAARRGTSTSFSSGGPGQLATKRRRNDATDEALTSVSSLKSMQEIIPGLWCGSYFPAMHKDFLKAHHITHICCCVDVGQFPFPEDFMYMKVPVMDTITTDIATFFPRTFEFIENALIKQQGAVLVHCGAGISRAPTVTAAYLIRKLRLSAAAAIALVQQRRPFTAPNSGFRRQLRAYAEKMKIAHLDAMREAQLLEEVDRKAIKAIQDTSDAKKLGRGGVTAEGSTTHGQEVQTSDLCSEASSGITPEKVIKSFDSDAEVAKGFDEAAVRTASGAASSGMK